MLLPLALPQVRVVAGLLPGRGRAVWWSWMVVVVVVQQELAPLLWSALLLS